MANRSLPPKCWDAVDLNEAVLKPIAEETFRKIQKYENSICSGLKRFSSILDTHFSNEILQDANPSNGHIYVQLLELNGWNNDENTTFTGPSAGGVMQKLLDEDGFKILKMKWLAILKIYLLEIVDAIHCSGRNSVRYAFNLWLLLSRTFSPYRKPALPARAVFQSQEKTLLVIKFL